MDIHDRAQDLVLAELEQLQRVRLQRAMRQVEVPINPVHCITCDLVIDPRRVRAMPAARHCTGCAEIEEKRGRFR